MPKKHISNSSPLIIQLPEFIDGSLLQPTIISQIATKVNKETQFS